MSLNVKLFWIISKMMGEKLRHRVCIKKIHFPFLEVGLNLQIPLEISWIIEEEIPDFFDEAAEICIYI